MSRRYATGVYISTSDTPRKRGRPLRVCRQQDVGPSQPLRDCHRGHLDSCITRDRGVFLVLQSREGVAPRLSTLSKFPAGLRIQHPTSFKYCTSYPHSLLPLITYVTKVSGLI